MITRFCDYFVDNYCLSQPMIDVNHIISHYTFSSLMSVAHRQHFYRTRRRCFSLSPTPNLSCCVYVCECVCVRVYVCVCVCVVNVKLRIFLRVSFTSYHILSNAVKRKKTVNWGGFVLINTKNIIV